MPLDSSYSDIELKSNEATICSEIMKTSPSEKQEWCKITRRKDQTSALMQNKRFAGFYSPVSIEPTLDLISTSFYLCGYPGGNF